MWLRTAPKWKFDKSDKLNENNCASNFNENTMNYLLCDDTLFKETWIIHTNSQILCASTLKSSFNDYPWNEIQNILNKKQI